MTAPAYVSITIVGVKVTTRYRFYGRGKWKVYCGSGEWVSINAILVDARAIAKAAELVEEKRK